MPRFTDKTVIITGAAGALGAGMVRRFAAEDARVIIGARQREQVADLLDELGAGRPVFAQLDVTSEQNRTGPLPLPRQKPLSARSQCSSTTRRGPSSVPPCHWLPTSSGW
jgi:NAD(P)-dependent dehydrogenase (short-subunit alcohol dehydrogenase family)